SFSSQRRARPLYFLLEGIAYQERRAFEQSNTDKGHPQAKASERKAADLNARTRFKRAQGRSGRRSDAEEGRKLSGRRSASAYARPRPFPFLTGREFLREKDLQAR